MMNIDRKKWLEVAFSELEESKTFNSLRLEEDSVVGEYTTSRGEKITVSVSNVYLFLCFHSSFKIPNTIHRDRIERFIIANRGNNGGDFRESEMNDAEDGYEIMLSTSVRGGLHNLLERIEDYKRNTERVLCNLKLVSRGSRSLMTTSKEHFFMRLFHQYFLKNAAEWQPSIEVEYDNNRLITIREDGMLIEVYSESNRIELKAHIRGAKWVDEDTWERAASELFRFSLTLPEGANVKLLPGAEEILLTKQNLIDEFEIPGHFWEAKRMRDIARTLQEWANKFYSE